MTIEKKAEMVKKERDAALVKPGRPLLTKWHCGRMMIRFKVYTQNTSPSCCPIHGQKEFQRVQDEWVCSCPHCIYHCTKPLPLSFFPPPPFLRSPVFDF